MIWAKTSPLTKAMRSCKYFPHVSKMSTLAYIRMNRVAITIALILMITLIIIWILWQRTCHIHIWHWLFCLETMVFLLPTTAIVLGDGYSRNAPCFMLVFRHTILIKRTVLFYVLCSSLVMCTMRNRNNQNGIAYMRFLKFFLILKIEKNMLLN